MAVEIERRFLVTGDGWKTGAKTSQAIRQAYLSATPEASVRVRIKNGETAALTIKSGRAEIARDEFEYKIPVADAEQLMALRTGIVIEKQRFIVPVGAAQWEIDVFAGALAGLVIAELELDSTEGVFERPPWIGREVTDDQRFSNATLATLGRPDAL
jgi:adenylate cyclase